MKELLVNVADWDPPVQVPAGHLIANAPRPISAPVRWEGPFLHGIFYAAGPDSPEQRASWVADDAWLIVFITDEEIRARVATYVKTRGYYDSIEAMQADGVTITEIARYSLQLPYSAED